MNVVVIGSIVICLSLVLGLAIALRRADAACHLPVTVEWIDDISVERYRPMARLLSHDDLSFLRTQPGYTPQMEARLRTQRCRIFLAYLRNLESDFARVCAALRILLAKADHDRPDLGATLIRASFQFALGASMARVQVQLYRWGAGSVDMAYLTNLFGSMDLELRRLVPAKMPAATA